MRQNSPPAQTSEVVTVLPSSVNPPGVLSVEQQAMVYGHLEEGKLSQAAIAELVGVTRQTIHYYAEKAKLSPKWILRSQGVDITHSWLRAIPRAEERGDIRPMERALLYGGHLEPLSESNKQTVVQVGFALTFDANTQQNAEPIELRVNGQTIDATIMPSLGPDV